MIHLKRLAFGAGVLTMVANMFVIGWGIMWVLFNIVLPTYPIQLGVVVFILLSYGIGVLIESKGFTT